MNSQELLTKLNWRYATKRFDPSKKIPENTWTTLEQAVILTPSSYGLQPWKFVVVTSPSVKAQLRPNSWNQPQIEECSHLVVFMSKEQMTEQDVDRYVEQISKTRGVSKDVMADYRTMMVGDVVKGPRSQWVAEWAARQVYIALGNLMTSAAVLDVDACPLEGIDPVKYDEILKVPGYKTRVALALGYRSAEDGYGKLAKVRFPKEDVIIRKN